MDTLGSNTHIPEIHETNQEDISTCRKMKRFRLTHNQSRYLMSEFARQAHPDAAHRERLSREIPGLSPRQVQVWFQNRRAKLKRMSSDDRYHIIKSRALPEEFPILQTLYSYDLAGVSRARATRSVSSCSSIANLPKEKCSVSSQDSDRCHNSFCFSAEPFARDCQSDSSGGSCQVSPSTPCSAVPRDLSGDRNCSPYRTLQDPFSTTATAAMSQKQPQPQQQPQQQPEQQPEQQQPFGSYFDQLSTCRASAYIFPGYPLSDSRAAKGTGDVWQSRRDMHNYPYWRPTLDTTFRDNGRQELISPQSCSSVTSDEYISENIDSHKTDSNHSASPFFDYSSAPRIVSLPLPPDSALNMVLKRIHWKERVTGPNVPSPNQT